MAASLANSLSSKSVLSGAVVPVPASAAPAKVSFNCRASAEDNDAVSRRAALALVAGSAALALKASPALAAYGEAANVFGKAPGKTDYLTFKGEGFSIDVPSKFNRSKETEFPGTLLRWEDNFDALANVSVLSVKSPVGSAKDLTAAEFLEKFNYLLGVQAFSKETKSEGGFAPGAAVSANILDSEVKSRDGKDYLLVNVLVRAADGNEGGRHVLFSSAVKDGKLYIARIQCGDKRWFKGAKKLAEGAWNSFVVA